MPPRLVHCRVPAEYRVPVPALNAPHPPVGAADPNGLLMLTAHAEFSCGKQTVDDVVVLLHAIIDELTIPLGSDDEQRRGLSLCNAAGHLDINLGPVVERGDRAPGRVVAFNRVAEPQSRDINALNDWRGCLGARVLAAQRDRLVLRILPGNRRPVGPLRLSEVE